MSNISVFPSGPSSFFSVSVRSLSFLLSLPFDAAAELSGLSSPPPRCRPLSVFSLCQSERPLLLWSLFLLWTALPLLRLDLSYTSTTQHLMALLVGARDFFMAWHVCQNLSRCRTSLCLCFILHAQKAFYLLRSTSFIIKKLHRCADINPIAMNTLGTGLED